MPAANKLTPASTTDHDGSGGVVDLDRVSLRYSAKRKSTLAVDDVSLQVHDGEFVTILGPSGCGKSTLLKLIAGLVDATEGSVTFNGHRVREPQKEVGYVFQKPVLLEWRGVLRNILLQAEMRGLPRNHAEARARELIRLTGLEGFEDALPHELSGGMQQRVALCRALLHEPSVILMDEPFGALDALTRERMNTQMNQLWRETRSTVVLVTHSIAEAIYLGTRIVVMSSRPGRIVAEYDIDLPAERDYGHVMSSAAYESLADELRTLLGTAEAVTE